MSGNTEIVHACAQLFLPADQAQKAIENALKENPNNASQTADFPVPPAGGSPIPAGSANIELPSSTSEPSSDDIKPPDGPLRLGLFVRKMWASGRTLRVLLLGGSPFVQSKVRQFAVVWSQYANIHFQFVNAVPAEIRVSFQIGAGSWSYLGTDALMIPEGSPTMNYGWFDDRTDDEEFSRTVTHEFGHAIGCVHEHQQPNANINWNKPFIYDYYYRNFGWTAEQVDFALFDRYSSADVSSTVLDRYSIMHYPIPREFTLDGYYAPNNTRLSPTDIGFIRIMYPFPSSSRGAPYPALDTGVANSLAVRPWDQPSLDSRITIRFQQPYSSVPKVLLGLDWLDFGSSRNLRIRALVETTTRDIVTINLQSWADTINNSSGAAYLVFAPGNDNFQTGSFSTTEDHDWNRPQPQTTRRIQFPRFFKAAPKVVVFLTTLDVDRNTDLRVMTYVTNVTHEAFTVHIDSWGDTRLYRGAINWVAYEASMTGIASGTYSTNDIRPWNQPRLQNSASISFLNIGFKNPPRVFMALNSLNTSRNRNTRIRASASNITTAGMVWHLDAWSDTILYSAGASYIAFAA